MPVNSEDERLFMVNLGCVKEASFHAVLACWISWRRSVRVHPDIFVVNEDGNMPEKRALCRVGIEYNILNATRTRAGAAFHPALRT